MREWYTIMINNNPSKPHSHPFPFWAQHIYIIFIHHKAATIQVLSIKQSFYICIFVFCYFDNMFHVSWTMQAPVEISIASILSYWVSLRCASKYVYIMPNASLFEKWLNISLICTFCTFKGQIHWIQTDRYIYIYIVSRVPI